MRTDKAKNIAKVTEVLVNNPLLTVREVAEETGVSKSSVANYINEDLDYDEILKNYEAQQKVLCEDIKQEIDNEILSNFIVHCGSKIEATKQIEDFMLFSIEGSNKRRKYIKGKTRYELLSRAGFKCQACGEKPGASNDIVLNIDHIVPFNRGGLDIIENYQVLCNKCNCSKSDNFITNHNK